jgi:hypothetical protein
VALIAPAGASGTSGTGTAASSPHAHRHRGALDQLGLARLGLRLEAAPDRHRRRGLAAAGRRPDAGQRRGDGTGLLAGAVAAPFIPALALALASWSGGSKLFEVTYLTLWHFGPMNQIVPHLDSMAVSDAARAAGMPLAYLAATLVVWGGTAAGRRRQVRG